MKHHVATSSIIDLVRMTKSHLTSCFVIQNELIMDYETNKTLRNYVFQIDIVSYYKIKSLISFHLTEWDYCGLRNDYTLSYIILINHVVSSDHCFHYVWPNVVSLFMKHIHDVLTNVTILSYIMLINICVSYIHVHVGLQNVTISCYKSLRHNACLS